jgi:uracil-DNA glycosylase
MKWKDAIGSEFEKPYFKGLEEFVRRERELGPVFPPHEDVLAALSFTPLEQVKVVIVGQDPYHGAGQAHGLSFSVRKGVPVPPSLANVLRELKEDVGVESPGHGCLSEWASRGVLLLNSALTVRSGSPKSHAGKGWEIFTDAVIGALHDRPCVFILWGKDAQEKNKLVNSRTQRIVASAHPSPRAADRGFFGSRPFSRANRLLEELEVEPVDWSLNP